ncbi:MAG TPA: hypothetical protein VH763_12125 [Gemmatimonadales bacterium]|jgi:hypothetical protein
MSAAIPLAIEPRADDTLDVILSPIHDRWIEQIGTLLAPAMVPQAPFWERWGAVRYLIDQFEGRFRMECALMDSLASWLSRSEFVRLSTIRAVLERTRVDLIALGRRRGTAMVVAAFAREILEQAQLWCAELEFATRNLHRSELSPESERLIKHLELAASLDR